jgi:23S rRNA (guanosine2251-2'-O)-methyltransferase
LKVMLKKSMQELERLTVEQFRNSKKIPLIVVLDNVRSAHNVGSIFRTCDAFRVEEIVLCGITPVPPDNEIRKTALGATESVSWRYEQESVEAISALKKSGYTIICVEQTRQAVLMQDFVFPDEPKTVVIFGHEVYGINEQIIKLSDSCIEIEQYGTKHSLNVSVCAGIVLYDFYNALMK